jgi:hypothetical protein
MKKKQGGKRKGSGRKPGSKQTTPKKEPTKVMRVPLSLVDEVKKLISKKRRLN